MNLGIAFNNVPIVTPFGDSVLVRSLDFSIRKGDHLMITGPNGSGKTAILRILAGLWPLFCGEITRPLESLNSILYVPQRPYLSIGTLRDQIIYPHTKKEMESAGLSDDDLWPILKLVFLDYIPEKGMEGCFFRLSFFI
jgi:ATP-binding cassette subfamily D (ALD) long-chain fatty acid import protein